MGGAIVDARLTRMHIRTAGEQTSVRDAGTGGRGRWHRGTRSFRDVHGLRSQRRREIRHRQG